MAHLFLALRCSVLPGRQSGDLPEYTMKVIGAHGKLPGEFLQGWGGLRFFNYAARLRNRDGIRVYNRGAVRPAALAGSEACRLGFFARGVKTDILGPRGTRTAGGTAVDARSPDSEIKLAVGFGVTRNDVGPTRVLDCCSTRACFFR
jgi:hypothetical protein